MTVPDFFAPEVPLLVCGPQLLFKNLGKEGKVSQYCQPRQPAVTCSCPASAANAGTAWRRPCPAKVEHPSAPCAREAGPECCASGGHERQEASDELYQPTHATGG